MAKTTMTTYQVRDARNRCEAQFPTRAQADAYVRLYPRRALEIVACAKHPNGSGTRTRVYAQGM